MKAKVKKPTTFVPTAIDYSSVPHQKHTTLADDTWEPPEHKFFGKKLPSGKMAKEPPYVFQEYPRMMYYKNADGSLKAAEVNSDEERDALGRGWKASVAEFGIHTAPSWEQMREQIEAAEAGEEAEPEAEDEPDETEDADPDVEPAVVAKAAKAKKTRRQPASRGK